MERIRHRLTSVRDKIAIECVPGVTFFYTKQNRVLHHMINVYDYFDIKLYKIRRACSMIEDQLNNETSER